MLASLLKKMNRPRLRDRFVISFIVFAVVPVLFLGGVGLYLIDFSHRRDVSSLELQLIDQKKEEITKFFADTLGTMELRLGSSTSRDGNNDYPQSSEEELAALLENMMNSNRAFEELTLVNRQGQEIEKRSRYQDDSMLSNISLLPRFTKTIEGQNYISNVYYTLSGPMITMASPVYNFDGVIVRILSAEVNLAPITHSIETAQLGSSGYLILLDGNGLLMTAGSVAKVPMGADLSIFERVRRIIAGQLSDALDERDYYESLIDKTPVVGAGKRLNNTGWVLLAEWPLSDANALMQNIRGQIVIMALTSILAVLLFAPLFASRLIKPIRQLEASAAEIEKGNFEYKVNIKTKDELEELGESFNNMTAGLKRLQELKNEFVFIAAHELRTPVTAIKGYLSMVFEEASATLTDSVKQSLEIVSKANERLVQLVNDILEIARSEAGRLKIEVAAVDIRESTRAILEETAPLAAEKKLTVNYEPPDDLPLVLADDARLKEIIMNFISNAIKYNRDGGSLKIAHEVSPDKIITHIADTGYGLSEEDQKHMFEKFFRSEAEIFKRVQGTGLGLFITKELVEKMGGQVWLKSEINKGSTFSFNLPRNLSAT